MTVEELDAKDAKQILSSSLQTKEDIYKKGLLFFQFLEFIPVGVFVIDSEGKPYFANGRAIQLLGKGIISGQSPGTLAETYQAYLSGTNTPYPTQKMPIVRALKGEKSCVEDMEIHRHDEVIHLRVEGAPIRDEEGKIIYAAAAFTDVSEI